MNQPFDWSCMIHTHFQKKVAILQYEQYELALTIYSSFLQIAGGLKIWRSFDSLCSFNFFIPAFSEPEMYNNY